MSNRLSATILKPHHCRLVTREAFRVQDYLIEIGMLKKRPGASLFVPIPDNLRSEKAIKERVLFHRTAKYFEAAFHAGRPVFHLTMCPPAWMIPPGELTAIVVRKLRDWASRKAREIRGPGIRRLLGGIDISFNPPDGGVGEGRWCVHFHALVTIVGLDVKRAKNAIKRAFPQAEMPECKGKSRHIIQVQTEVHLLRTISYISGCFSLRDHNNMSRRDRRLRVSGLQGGIPSDEMLPAPLAIEFAALMAAVPPYGFWICSGFRRRGERVEPEGGYTEQETIDEGHRNRNRKSVKRRLERDPTCDHADIENLRIFSRRSGLMKRLTAYSPFA